MAEETTIVLSRGGTHERIMFVEDIEIKDLWHAAMAIKNGDSKYWSQKIRDKVFEEIIGVWELTHDLKKHIIEKIKE